MSLIMYPLSENLTETFNLLCRCRNFTPNVHFKKKKSAPTVGAVKGTIRKHFNFSLTEKERVVK